MVEQMHSLTQRKSRIVGNGDIEVSFEFFPPKTEKMEEALWTAVRRLEPLAPDFVSVTYGAGGSTRERTHNTVARLVRETALNPAAHLTCVNATKAEVDDVIRGYAAAGVRHVVALRGDPQAGVGTKYEPHPGGYAQAADLVASIKRIGGFEVSVGGYPEKHPESATFDADIDYLKAKVDAGADRIITQFFFRQRALPALPRAGARARHLVPGAAGHRADPQFQTGLGLRRQDRHDRAGLAGAAVRRPGR